MKKMKILKLGIYELHQIDPTADALMKAIKITVPGIFGLFCFMYFRQRFTFWIILMPVLLLPMLDILSTYKQKLLNCLVLFFLLGAMQFTIAIFYDRPYVLILVMFILILISVSSIKYRVSSIQAVLFAVIYLCFPQGWYNGTNRLIELIFIALITIVSVLVFEYLFTKLKLRNTIIYFLELICDAFNILTGCELKNKKSLKYTYLFERPLSFKADFEVEKLFKTEEDKYSHKLSMELANKGKCIVSEEFVFKKNRIYKIYIYSIFILIKRMYRSIVFMVRFNSHKTDIYKLYPSTPLLVQNIRDIFEKIILSFKEDQIISDYFDEKLLQDWNKECRITADSGNKVVDDEIIDSIYGLKCLILDLQKIEKILYNRHVELSGE